MFLIFLFVLTLTYALQLYSVTLIKLSIVHKISNALLEAIKSNPFCGYYFLLQPSLHSMSKEIVLYVPINYQWPFFYITSKIFWLDLKELLLQLLLLSLVLVVVLLLSLSLLLLLLLLLLILLFWYLLRSFWYNLIYWWNNKKLSKID